MMQLALAATQLIIARFSRNVARKLKNVELDPARRLYLTSQQQKVKRLDDSERERSR